MKKLGDAEAFALLRRFRIPAAKQFLAKNEKAAVSCAKRIGYPLAMKISSRDIIHKTESGGVILNVRSDNEAAGSFNRLMRIEKKRRLRVDGVLVQEMAKGHEVIIGSKLDPQFGPVMVFGLGGVFVEVFKDISMRLVPIERSDAREMIREIKGYEILNGARGRRPVNFQALERCILNVSAMISKNKRIREMDINPLFVNEKGVLAVDARIFIE